MPFSALTRRSGGNVLIDNGPEAYDAIKAGPRTVLKMGPSDYRMWYEGIPTSGDTTVCYATSIDGRSWTKYGSNPVMSPSVGWENDEVAPTSIIWDGSQFILYFHGGGNTGPRAIGRATSSDGISWTKYGSNPILEKGAATTWDDDFIADSKVLRFGASDWRMWYRGDDGSNGRIGYATSSDGLSWSKSGSNPIIDLGSAGEWDDDGVVAIGLYYDAEDKRFYGWYAGNKSGVFNGVGFAYSEDGISWTKSPQNPVLVETASESGGKPGDTIDVYEDGKGNLRILYGDFDIPTDRHIREALFHHP